MNTGYNVHDAFPLLYCLPLRIPLAPLFDSLPLTWNPPCCDRIRPPRSPIACKLNSLFPCPCSLTPHSEILTPRGSSPPNIHSLGRYREPGSQDPVQVYSLYKTVYTIDRMLTDRRVHEMNADCSVAHGAACDTIVISMYSIAPHWMYMYTVLSAKRIN